MALLEAGLAAATRLVAATGLRPADGDAAVAGDPAGLGVTGGAAALVGATVGPLVVVGELHAARMPSGSPPSSSATIRRRVMVGLCEPSVSSRKVDMRVLQV
jgi:hypothetical protein